MTVQKLSVVDIPITLHRVVSALGRGGDRVLRSELGISHSRAMLLLVVDREGPMSQSDLATHLGSTGPAVTALLREVAGSGYVEVTRDPANRRIKRVSLTANGKSVVDSASELLQVRFSALLARAEVDGEELLQMLSRITEHLVVGGSN